MSDTQQPQSTEAQAKEELQQKYPALAEFIQNQQAEQQRKLAKQKSGMSKYGGTYYKKHFAEELKFVLDAILVDGKDRIYFYAKFPGYSKTTLEMKLRQSWLYLNDNMDPTGKYAELLAKCQLGEDKNKTGIRIKILRETLSAADIVMPDIVEDETKNFEWRPELDAFLLNGAVGTMFKRENLNLGDDAVDNLCTNLSQLSNIEFKVTNRKILIIKTE